MPKDYSFGIIPLQKENTRWLILLIKHRSGYWAFPKGHAEDSETPIEAATRELMEETGLQITHILSTPPFTEHYTFYHQQSRIDKMVTYFVAEVSGQVILQLDEVSESLWTPLENAHDHVTFPEAKRICTQLNQLLNVKHPPSNRGSV